MSSSDQLPDPARRNLIKRALYVPPAMLTLEAAPAFAKAGSEKPKKFGHPTHPEHPIHPEHLSKFGKRTEKLGKYEKRRL